MRSQKRPGSTVQKRSGNNHFLVITSAVIVALAVSGIVAWILVDKLPSTAPGKASPSPPNPSLPPLLSPAPAAPFLTPPPSPPPPTVLPPSNFVPPPTAVAPVSPPPTASPPAIAESPPPPTDTSPPPVASRPAFLPSNAVLVLSQRGVLTTPGNVSLFETPYSGSFDVPHYFADLNSIRKYKNGDGTYEFILTWPDVGVYNHWFQNTNPAISPNVLGFAPLNIQAPYSPPPYDAFVGLQYDAQSFGALRAAPTYASGFVCGAFTPYYSPYSYPTNTWDGFSFTNSVNATTNFVSSVQLYVVGTLTPDPVKPTPVTPAPLAGPPIGYDIVVIAGQSNAVGYGLADGLGNAQNDDTTGLPVFAFTAGSVNTPPQFQTTWVEPNQSPGAHNPTTYNEAGFGRYTDFGVNFTKNYIANGFLGAGRAVLIVNTGLGNTPLGWWGNNYGAASAALPGSAVMATWTPSVACDPSFGNVSFATSIGQANLVTNLVGYSKYRVDLAMTIDPATGVNHSTGLTPFAQNKIVAVLWHQGEADFYNHYPVEHWALCMSDLVDAYRNFYGLIPFIGGGFATFTYDTRGDSLENRYLNFYRKNFGNGRYVQNFTGIPVISPATGNTLLGYADPLFTYSGDMQNMPLNGDQVHFTQTGTQIMGSRYAEAYAAMFGV